MYKVPINNNIITIKVDTNYARKFLIKNDLPEILCTSSGVKDIIRDYTLGVYKLHEAVRYIKYKYMKIGGVTICQ